MERPVPHFYMNVFNDITVFDEEGIDCENLAEATADAIKAARELISTSILDGQPVSRSHRIEITDPDGHTLHVVRFGDIVDLRP
jgi:hypothetical protein